MQVYLTCSFWNSFLTVCIDNKALYFSLRGKALNVTTKHDTQAVDFLSKAVKLDPSLTEAWNNLGECYWKSKDIDAAKNCFTQALAKVFLNFNILSANSLEFYSMIYV